MAFTETIDALGLVALAFRDELLAKVNAAIDGAAANDKAALGEAQRQEMEASITFSRLEVERREAATVWHAEARGEIIDWRAGTSPHGACPFYA